MKRKKKIAAICCIVGVLLLAFWYGGDAPGLRGFSDDAASRKETYISGQDNGVAQQTDLEDNGKLESSNGQENASLQKPDSSGQDNGKSDDGTSGEKRNWFQQILMKITQTGSSDISKNKNRQNSKKAQKNAKNAVADNQKQSKKKTTSAKRNETTAHTTSVVSDNPVDGSSEHGGTTQEKQQETADVKAAQPAETAGSTQTVSKDSITCTISISCATVLEHINTLPGTTKKVIPKDGIMLSPTAVTVSKDATVFDVLKQVTKDNGVHLEFNYTPAQKNYYIEGIGNLYEFDAGNLSGWMFSVNDEFPGVGCSSYKVKDGDVIRWVYTCDLGKDVGDYYDEGK